MSATGDATDGGRDLPTAEAFAVGDTVRDCEDNDPDPATVVKLPPVECSDWELTARDATVAEDNPEYDPDAEVVVVAFDEGLANYAPDWDGEEPLSLGETDVYVFAFPPGRLAPVEEETETAPEEPEPVDETETTDEPPQDPLDGFDAVRDLKERLAERSDVRVEADGGEPVLVVNKLGVDHRIHADGSVSDGPFLDRLRDVAAAYLGGEP